MSRYDHWKEEKNVTNEPFYEILDVTSLELERYHKTTNKIECFLEDEFLGSQWSIILGYRRLSVESSKLRR
jgi:hypothetical protein